MSVHSWRSHPDMKVEVGSTEITQDGVNATVYRLENAISRAKLVANNHQGKLFIGSLDTFDILKISFRYGSDSWTQVFEGNVEETGPVKTVSGHTVSALAYGYGRALRLTHCDENFGAESENTTLDTPTEIWDDLVDNRINKNFDGGSTGYALTKTKIKTVNNPTIQFIKGGYRKNIYLLNEVALVHQGYQGSSAGVHWFVDPSKNVWIDTIGSHSVDTTNWPTWWRTNQAGSTLVDGLDISSYSFTKNIRGFANKIVLITDLRKPGYDYWTEDSGGASLWGNDSLKTLEDSTTQYIVGSHSLRLETDGANNGTAYYPSGENANWDITKCGSEHTIPTLNFYYYKDSNIGEATTYVRIFTTEHDTNYWYASFCNWQSDPDDKWNHCSIPIGPYWQTVETAMDAWTLGAGSPSWSNVDGIAFNTSVAGGDANLYIDDLHIAGKIVREAYNSTSISANDEHQRVMRLDVAVDDTLVAGTATGTAGYLAYAELLHTQKTPMVGTVTIPGSEDLLPGQQVHIHADEQASGAFRVDSTVRVSEIQHMFDTTGFTSTVMVSDDVTNTFANDPSGAFSALAKVMYVDPEARSLKSSGVDELIERLSKDYP